MTRDRIMAGLALAVFIIFSAIMVYRVGRLDLAVVMATGVLLASADLFMQLGPRRRR